MSNAVVQVTQEVKKGVTIERVREKLEERAAELALLFWRELRSEENSHIWCYVNDHSEGRLQNLIDRLIDVEEYIDLCDLGTLHGGVV
ncbi:hypothetical protein [Thermanaeromonas sp. C210]|uniref:hypothetical protein n=1 Tax=Thermanaeromonas sp. C210 TaxID=2731925 RepID=UPI00155C7CBC|nr:hypothetical protein [Thermanaeromonas sp. C210]GFN22174.1 hypothetical protein TAMC210_04900 [Thermanaeromonas sp. C210]